MKPTLTPDGMQTISGVLPKIFDRSLSSRELVERCLAQADTKEFDLMAWVQLDREAALAQADAQDARLSHGEAPGPLQGIPFGIKDLIDVAGYPTGAGSALRAEQIVDRDADVVARLRNAGAVILGKTVTTQFGCFDPPVTRNPWNRDRTPGGSSSGSAAAVAAGMCYAALGSQTGGSVIRPASFCGLCGYKPTRAAISTEGAVPVSGYLDHIGPLARTVDDVYRVAAVLNDSLTPLGPTESLSSTSPISHPKLGRLRHDFDEKAEPAMRECFDRALTHLTKAGAAVSDAPWPATFAEVWHCHRVIMLTDMTAYHRQTLAKHPDDFKPGIRGLLQEGLTLKAVDYLHALEHQCRFTSAMNEILDDFDVLVTPAARGPAPSPETTGDPSFNAPFSYTGQPVVTIPMGLSPEGLPMGLQIIGQSGKDEEVIRTAAWCEEQLRGVL
ncbi:MAG: amidase [Planctomycetota bacterium]|nr:amidase [Planctomycetota bacterium]MDA1211124.1 amidase [Planctomycetota bacterium]